MTDRSQRAVAIVGLGAILPDALNAPAFWQNIANKRYSITETPPDRWSIADYYDPDPSAVAKTYSKIGSWVRGFQFDWKRFHIPPRVTSAMDEGQQWGVTIAAEALADYGYPERPLDLERTGCVLGQAMAGELHYKTTLRILFPEWVRALSEVNEFRELPADVRQSMLANWAKAADKMLPPITEDTMPGELANVISGRIANVLNLRGPNFITDAACASTFAALDSAVDLLVGGHCDAVLSGGVDRNMGTNSFVKFCKIGALSATGTRPFGDGADGFVMGEGSAVFLLKRLADAERDGDKIYAVIRGVGGSSDGKGKGITAPNPVGQKLAIARAWKDSGLDPATCGLVEAHGTSTKVGDVVEVESLAEVFKGARNGSIALGSAKSNIGHLKAGAGAAGMLKAIYAVHHRMLPPTLNAEKPNPNIDFANSPFVVNHELREWKRSNGTPLRCGVSAYGFGGTNFHLVLEEHVPGMLTRKPMVAVSETAPVISAVPVEGRKPMRGIVALGAQSPAELERKLKALTEKVKEGYIPPVEAPGPEFFDSSERLCVDFGGGPELYEKLQKAQRCFAFDTHQVWRSGAPQGIFRGQGQPPGKVAFLFPGQGSQYINMGRELSELQPAAARVFAEADRVMTTILGRPLTSYFFSDAKDEAGIKEAERTLMQTQITQPAMLTCDTALYEVLKEYSITPDIVMGHSLGEYAALIAAGIMPFAHALEASAARGREMTRVSLSDNGKMAAVMAPLQDIERVLRKINGYAVAANINSNKQCVIGGESAAVDAAVKIFKSEGIHAVLIPVSHAFHTRIVAPASEPLRVVLNRLSISLPRLPLVANVTGELYPHSVEEIKEILVRQIASPVQWVKGLTTLYGNGVRMFVECGPKRALKGFTDDVIGEHAGVWSLFTNHNRPGQLQTFNHALCGLYAAGYGAPKAPPAMSVAPVAESRPAPAPSPAAVPAPVATPAPASAPDGGDVPASLDALTQALTQALSKLAVPAAAPAPFQGQKPYDRNDEPLGSIVITGTGLGLPGAEKPVMDPTNAERILRGEQFVDLIPERFRQAMAKKNVTRIVKSEDGSGSFETIQDTDDVIKLAGRPGFFDLSREYGVSEKLIEALDITTQLAMAAGLDALREAGIPLVQTFKKTTKGTFLPDRWVLPEALRDETGVIFCSAFPGLDRFADEMKRYYAFENLRQQLATLEDLRLYTKDGETLRELNRRIQETKERIERDPYVFDRRFLFRVLSMGHSQFAEYIGARGPNTQVNAACASTANGIGLAEDWIRTGRCRRVLVIGADNVTSEHLIDWIGAGFLATGAAATDHKVEEAALPFDRRRHGTLMGMGACALVVESQDAAGERGVRGIVELLSTETRNSAFHGTRLDVEHISEVMDSLITSAERRFGVNRHVMASETVFMSHETFTPARGGSASAEVAALRKTFGSAASEIVMANTKGFTGHPMGVGVEDVLAVKILEHGIVPPVPNFKEVDPDLGPLTLSRGGRYPVKYAIHLAAGFGSQIALTLTRKVPGGLDRFENKVLYRRWLEDISGYDHAEVEVHKRVLRVVSKGVPQRVPVGSYWKFGLGPEKRCAAPAHGGSGDDRPLPMQTAVSAPAVEVKPAPAPAPVKPVEAPRPPEPKVEAPRPVEVKAPEAPKPAPAAAVAVAPAPAPVPAPVAAPAPEVKAAKDPVTEAVLGIIAAKTGYPADMLDFDLDLEADLGIDTVKQAETFAAVREQYGIARQDNLKLRDFPTVRHVVQFVFDNRPDLVPAKAPAAAPTPAPVTDIEVWTAPEAAPAVVAPAPAAVAPAPAAAEVSPVQTKVLEIIASKTGYPPDMLDLDLDLEADLGVDTVKQAETFAAVREEYGIARQDNLKLRDFPTVRHVVNFVYDYRPDLKPSTAPAVPVASAPVAVAVPEPLAANESAAVPVAAVESAPAAAAPAPEPAAVSPVQTKVLAIIAEKTGYPPEMLDLDLDLEADLGVDTVKQAETFAAVRQEYDIPRQDNLKLRDFPTVRHVVNFVYDNRPELRPTAAPVATAAPMATAEPVANAAPVPAADVQAPADVSAPAPVQDTLAPEAAPAPAETPAAPAATSMVEAKVAEIIAEKTGYPQDMLDPDLDLEADLGVDTVKQAETFAAVREVFGIARQDNLKLRDFPTMRHVVQFVYDNRPDLRPTGAPASASPAAVEEPPVPAPVQAEPTVEEKPAATLYDLAFADLAPRRVPVPSLRPALDLLKPTGVELVAGTRVLIMSDGGGVGEALSRMLADRGVSLLMLTPMAAEDLENVLQSALADEPIHGVFWLPALDVEPPLMSMDLAAFREANRVRVKNLFRTMRTLYESVSRAGTFLVSATRLGGLLGYGADGASAPLGGAVSGFTKAYKREQGDVTVKVVDFGAGAAPGEIALALIDEAVTDPGVVEVGYHDGNRYTITFEEQPSADGQPGLTLDSGSVFLVTGAAGGITSAIVADLAAASGGTFYLMDLVATPARDDEKIRLFRTDREALKKLLIDEAKARGERPTPVLIDKQILAIERSHSALSSIEAVEAAGGRAEYRSVNLLDGPAVAAVAGEIRERHGKIDVLLHAGGIEISRKLTDKEPREFDLVFDIKADGFFSLLKAAEGMPVGATVAFSSVAGRFGNSGQADYSSANDLLCKLTSHLRTLRPETRGIAIDWTAWGGIGMATRGSIPKIMEAAGIDMLPPEAGVPTIRRELVSGGFRGEIVVGLGLGILAREWDATGGLDTEKVRQALAARPDPLVMMGEVKAARLYGGLEVATTLDPNVQPFLYDHAMDGTPLLPGVMGTETFAELASVMCPGYKVAAVENEIFERPFKYHRMQPQTFTLAATAKPAGKGEILVSAVLKSITQPKPELPAQERVHFRANVRMAREVLNAPRIDFHVPDESFMSIKRGPIYEVYFHGPAYQVLESVGIHEQNAVGLMAQPLPANASPSNAASFIAPRLLEFCFQTAGIWEVKAKEILALPTAVRRATAYHQESEAWGKRLYALVTAVDGGEEYDARVVDETGLVYLEVEGYRTVALPGKKTL
ncbi:MAG: Acyl carrier protein [Thermoanaerobaculia bacterium]|nr:Acyl carrier protein [Thermoanaerobaculia bacterium]